MEIKIHECPWCHNNVELNGKFAIGCNANEKSKLYHINCATQTMHAIQWAKDRYSQATKSLPGRIKKILKNNYPTITVSVAMSASVAAEKILPGKGLMIGGITALSVLALMNTLKVLKYEDPIDMTFISSQ